MSVTMTRPQMIRADTIDLQNHNSPSTQDHSRNSTKSPPTAGGAPRHAPHQDQTIRNAEQESINEQQGRGPASPTNPGQKGLSSSVDGSNDPNERAADDTNDSRNGSAGTYAGSTDSVEDDTLGDSEGEDQLDDDLMDKISSSPSIDDEDIDFEFVYALHTFVATVEGQANATKGDTMVLLDDSNSYWWLVRVVKDGSIGYLPAEHIETPTERLARLNKHRNIDLSATMLGDNAEKSKNPLKKAMRRRNAKTVTFSSPTYFETFEDEYSTEEDEDKDEFFEEEDEVSSRTNSEAAETQQDMSNDEDMVVKPLRPKQQQQQQQQQQPEQQSKPQRQQQQQDSQQPQQSTRGVVEVNEEETAAKDSMDQQEPDKEEEMTRGRSRNGTVRNTDSFFKDDSVETKKISLTPNLLRDDAGESASAESREPWGRASSDSFEKSGGSGDKAKEDKKRKEKKSGMLSGLFKRKDRKSKAGDDDGEEPEKISEESARSSTPPKTSIESLKEEARPPKPQHPAPQRHPSKLQKAPPPELSSVKEAEAGRETPQSPAVEEEPNKASLRMVQSESQNQQPVTAPQPLQVHSSKTREQPADAPAQYATKKEDTTSEIPVKFATTDGSQSASPIDRTQADFQSSSDSSHKPREQPKDLDEPTVAVPPPLASHARPETSPTIEVETVGKQGTDSHQKPFAKEPQQPSPQFPPPSATSPSEHLTATQEPSPAEDKPRQLSPTAINDASWSDASLRSYLEDGSEIRDLLVIIHDKSNVAPTGADHPITGSLFKEESKSLGEMSTRLDDMLNSWLTQRSLSYIR